MSGPGRIIQGIKECSCGDKTIEQFLINLLLEESGQADDMLFLKDVYKAEIDKALKVWSESDED
ncbi:MAG: hypothetical protein PWQ59_1939 [Thermoanaerobacterium sp.]|nr:hypothetical protein [Thermoanaerobacterium sp.]MDN5346210.1 hypothetical protein [Petrotoga sp.]HCF38760.1 hypothetical protein [Thermosipho africanus]